MDKKEKCKVDREKVISTISRVLDGEEKVIFAYLWGSFVKEESFEDIDIFVYGKDFDDNFTLSSNLKERIYEEFLKEKIDLFSIDEIDVNIINDAPYDFVIDILREGLLLVDKDPELRTDYIERISDEYRTNYFILEEAFK
jgi:predicted nucleotidyltransferase